MLLPRCNLCATTETQSPSLRRCTGCRIVRYCSTEHQTADWPSHKSTCNEIKKSRKKMEVEEEKLRNTQGDGLFTPENPFETAVGHFWGIWDTRPYMRARIDFVLKYLKVPTLDSVQSGLDDLLNMLRLCRGDNLGVRDIVPGLYIRLQRDQTCYDFLKWYATEGERGDYDWGDMSLPYLNLKDEDVMEDPVGLFKPEWHASHVVPVLLIKLRMLLDLKDLVASKVLETLALPSEKGPEPKLNFDVLQEIRREIATRSGVWSSRPQLLEPKDLEKRVETLEKQVQWLFVEIHGANKFLWKGMLEHEEWLKITPGPYSHGMQSEALLLVHNNAWSWIETEGAMEWLKQQVAQLG